MGSYTPNNHLYKPDVGETGWGDEVNISTDAIDVLLHPAATAGVGISVDAAQVITNTSPDQTVAIASGASISVTGTYPSFTVANTDPDQVVVLTEGTSIEIVGTYPNFTITNTDPDQVVTFSGGTNVTIGGTYPSFSITDTSQASDAGLTSLAGLVYSAPAFVKLTAGDTYGLDTTIYLPQALTDTYIFVGNGSGVAVGVQMTGDVTISNTGVTVVANDSHTHNNTTVTLALDDLSDVIAASPNIDEYLRYNGSNWVNAPGGTVSAGPSSVFFLDNDATTGAYQALLSSPDTVTPEEQDSVVVNNSEGLIQGFLYNTALGNTTIPSGVWEFNFFAYVSTATAVSTLIYDIHKVVTHAGTVAITGTGTSRTATVTGSTPFVAGDANADVHLASYVQTPDGTFQITAYTSNVEVTIATDNAYVNESGVAFTVHQNLISDESGEINNLTTPVEIDTIVVHTSFSVNATDKLALRVYGKTTHTSDVTITISHNSTDHYSHFHAPLAITHNQLSGLQGGTSGEFYHLTSAEYSDLHVPATAGTGIDVTGQAVSLDHLGIEDLTDPNADRLAIWDDVDGSMEWVTIGSNLSYDHATHTISATGGGGATLTQSINQVAHGFAQYQWVYHNGTGYALADASAAASAESIGIISAVAGLDDFTVQFGGRITGLSGLTAGQAHFLSETAGAITATAPVTEGAIVKPVLVADSTTSGYIFNMRGFEVTGTTSWYQAFTNADLTAGVLTVNHNLGHKYAIVQIYDNNDDMVMPDGISLTDANNLDVDLTSYGAITGTWRVIVLDVGTTNSSVASDLSLSGQTSGDRVVFNGSNWVRKPACLFAAYMTGDTLIAASGVSQDVEFDTEVYDIGGNFNTSNYTFTAPYTGYYDLKTSVMWKFLQTDTGELDLIIVTTGQSYYIGQWFNFFGLTGAITRWSQFNNVIAYMVAGDTAKVQVQYNGTTGTTAIDDGTALNSTWFQGYLIA